MSIEFFSYNPANDDLQVGYKDGSVWKYWANDMKVYERFMSSSSTLRAIREEIQQGNLIGERVS